MDTFLKAAAGVLIATLLCLTLSKQSKDFSIVLIIAVCVMVAVVALDFLQPVFTLLRNLATLGQLDTQMLKILFKSVGIGLLSEFVCTLCTDAGYASMGKALQLLASIVILYMSVPLFSSLIELIQSILTST